MSTRISPPWTLTTFRTSSRRCFGAMGYYVSWVSPPGPDRGIDIVAYTDPLGAPGPRIKAQVKRRADKTAVDGVRAFLAMLGTHDVGLFIATGGFTGEAEREVRSQENRRVTLISTWRSCSTFGYSTTNQLPTRTRIFCPSRPSISLQPGIEPKAVSS